MEETVQNEYSHIASRGIEVTSVLVCCAKVDGSYVQTPIREKYTTTSPPPLLALQLISHDKQRANLKALLIGWFSRQVIAQIMSSDFSRLFGRTPADSAITPQSPVDKRAAQFVLRISHIGVFEKISARKVAALRFIV